jgi:hypothetical protein
MNLVSFELVFHYRLDTVQKATIMQSSRRPAKLRPSDRQHRKMADSSLRSGNPTVLPGLSS